MADRDLELSFNSTLGGKQDKPQKFRAVITDSEGNRTGTGSIWFNEVKRLVWFQAWGSGSLGWALCDNIEPVIGLGVLIAFEPLIGSFEVLRDDPLMRLAATATTVTGSRIVSNQQIGRGGRFQLWVEPEMLQPLATYPGTGLAVNVVAGDYEYFGTRKTYDGRANFSISAHQPAGPSEHCLVGLYLDSSNVLQSVAGSTVATSTTAPEPTWPADVVRLAVVDLDDTQTSISLADDIDNRRVLWTLAGASSPLTTKGDIYVYDTDNARLPVGTDGQVLSADSAETTGLKWIDAVGSIVKNTSGASVSYGAVGYINEAGEFKTTTTAQAAIDWHVVLVGGANNANIQVVNRGRVFVQYTGTAPSAGDFVVTSTTAGLGQQQTTMHPNIFGVALAAGSGGLVEVLLLTQSKLVVARSSNNIYAVTNHSGTNFVATINGTPSATSVVHNAPSAGSNTVFDPLAAGYLGQLVLFNTTRSNFRLVTDCNTGTSTFTTVSSTDDWANGDTIRLQSVIIGESGPPYYAIIDLTQQTEIPKLARAVFVDNNKSDSSSADAFMNHHPYIAFGAGNTTLINSPIVVNKFNPVGWWIPLYQQRFGWRSSAGGSGTSQDYLLLGAYLLAAP